MRGGGGRDVRVGRRGAVAARGRPGGGWSNYRTTVVDVDLAAGADTITFANASSGYVPNVDLIQIAAPVG